MAESNWVAAENIGGEESTGTITVRRRAVCATTGCNNVTTLREKAKSGKAYYRKWCSSCRNLKRGRSRNGKHNHALTQQPCKRCGWSEGPCDRHRLVPEKGYTDKTNLVPLCPNCHRLVTLGLIELGETSE